MNWLTKLFKRKHKVIEFPRDTSWVLNSDLSVNTKNIKHCRVFQALKETKHSTRWHKEGNPLKHSLLVASKMHDLITGKLSYMSLRDKKVLMIAAICHDLGKATTTYYDEKENDWKCKNHGAVGERIVRDLFYDDSDHWFREEVCWLVRWHMQFHHFGDKSHDESFKMLTTLSQGYSTIEKLMWLNAADSYGSKNDVETKDVIDDRVRAIREMADTAGCFNKPYLWYKKQKYDFTMYMMIGVPGCGKDTYIKKFMPDLESICRDDIREDITDGQILGRKLLLDKTREAVVTDIVNTRIKVCCTEKRSFIVNQTNLKRTYRNQLKEVALKYGTPRIVYVYVEPPSINECKERRGHGKWDAIIDRMWNEFEFPDRSECNELIFYKQAK